MLFGANEEVYFTLFVKDGCPYCDKAVECLKKEKTFEFAVINVDHSLTAFQTIKNKYNWDTVPMVFRVKAESEELIGGSQELEELLGELQ